jgi:hypothetical protein
MFYLEKLIPFFKNELRRKEGKKGRGKGRENGKKEDYLLGKPGSGCR